MACAAPFSAAASGAQAPALPILVYHQIRQGTAGPPDDLDVISLERFESQMRYLKDRGYITLSAHDVIDFVRQGRTPGPRIVAIHFDDGWKSALAALPVLERYNFQATFWIIAGKGIGWPHMDWNEVEAISRNPRYTIGSHTMTHPWKNQDTLIDWLTGRKPDKGVADVSWELSQSRQVLQQKLGRHIDQLAWPRGLYNDPLIALAKDAGYVALFTVDDGLNRHGDNLLRLRRTMIHGGCDERAFEETLHSGIYQACGSGDGSAGGSH